MDNVTHTIAGFLVAEALVQWRARRGEAQSQHFGRAAYATSAIANNLPDIDFVYTAITRPAPLGYLLHHRGHTHTVLGGLVLVGLFLAVAAAVATRFKHRGQDRERGYLLGLGLFGPILHMAMDYSNNYGVHPFWPLYNGWVYGDFVFIIEPMFFALGVPVLLCTLRSLPVRIALGLALLAVLALSWFLSFVALVPCLVVTAVAVLSFWVGRTRPGAFRVLFAIGGSMAVALTFFLVRLRADAIVRASIPEGAAVHDIVLTPAPANPTCWHVWRVLTHNGLYVAERGVAAVWPALIDAQNCRLEADNSMPTARLTASSIPVSATLRWKARYEMPITELVSLQQSNCHFAAYLRFSRIPYTATSPTHGTVVGDLRYDRSPDLEFAEMPLPQGGPCPEWVPPWIEPRHPLLNSAQ